MPNLWEYYNPVPVPNSFMTTTLVTRVGNFLFLHFAPPHHCAMLTKHFDLMQVCMYLTIFQHWKGEWGCLYLFIRNYGYEFMFLPFSNTICPRLSEFSYILNAKNLHRNLQIRTKRGTRTIYHLLNKMTANIWLRPNSLTWFAAFIFPQNWGF